MKIKFLSLFMALVLASTVNACAETLSSVDGKKIEFCLEDSLPQNSAADVELDSNIKLLFNKNVVNMTVKENNSKCIKLKDEDGQVVPSELIFPDDQVEPDKKREIYIDPAEDLKENTTYTVEISPDMLAKNGSTLGEAVYISFTTISNAQEIPEAKNTEQPVERPAEVINATQPETTEEITAAAEEFPMEENAAEKESLSEEDLKTDASEDSLQPAEESSSQAAENNVDDDEFKDFDFVYAVIVIVAAASAFVVYKKIKKR